MFQGNVTIGADPEVFVKSGGSFVSGHIYPLGSKHQPTQITFGAVQNDGLALEFNVIPSRTRVEFVDNCVKVFKELDGLVKVQDPTAELSPTPTVIFGSEYLKTLPAEVAQLGCNPDYNAYTREENVAPNAELPFRTGSGHVHIGFDTDHPRDSMPYFLLCCDIVAQLDFFLGLPSLQWDKDTQRRALYGKAGAFRPKPYGLEYRVLSNAWLADEKLMAFVYERTLAALDAMDEGDFIPDAYGQIARDIINSNDMLWAEKYPDLTEFAYNA